MLASSMLAVLVAVSPCKEEVVTSQAGINAAVELAAPSLLALALALLALAPSSLHRWEALSVVRANLAVGVVLLLPLLLMLLLVVLAVPFFVGVGSRDVLRALPPVAAADRTLLPVVVCALGSASLDRMGRSRTQT